jgi:DNA gyrase/topoisomerase IV subunit B
VVILKELVDNAIDAAEEAGIPPVVAVTVDRTGIMVEDNGPGIPANVVARITERLKEDPALRWDAVLREIAEHDHGDAAP